MSAPLILQIQQAAIDSNASLADALRKTKVAASKLELTELGIWVERELSGYDDCGSDDLPPYRSLMGVPQALNPWQGWQNIGFNSQDMFDILARVPVATSIPQLESSLMGASENEGCFSFSYTIRQQNFIWSATGHQWPVRVQLETSAMSGILNSVRNILTDWTLKLEKQGVLGEGLMFSPEEKKKSAIATGQMTTQYQHRQCWVVRPERP